ncbi:MAG: TrkH family potassium uptake protein [Alphaproteobacteria bacterium]|nr:TrkH family potassium uptake protein [Alphaproteobacteria bacterium]
MLTDIYFGYSDWIVFFVCMIVTAFFGSALILSNHGLKFNLSARDAFILTNITWVVLPCFGALPFWLSSLNLSFTDSFFEAMSGITTTGSTIIIDLDHTPAGILLWRAILQWLGGIGIIIMAMSILPFLKIGGMQVFKAELAEDKKAVAVPRSKQLATSIILIYVFLTMLCAIGYIATGLSSFDAIAHAMTTISTGGFSTFNSSFDHFTHIGPSIIAIIFMILGGVPFVLYVKAVKDSPKLFFMDSQLRCYLSIIAVAAISLGAYLAYTQHLPLLELSVTSLFNVVSIMTGTGYGHGEIHHWGSFAVILFFFLMAVGGCAGSTSSGVKIFRLQVLYSITKVQIRGLLYPNGLFLPHYNGGNLAKDVPPSVMGFLFVYGLGFAILTLALAYVGVDLMTATSGAMSSLSNVGPGLSDLIGTTGNFQPLPDSAKWILSAGMLLGRLEMFTILVMFSPDFWKH